MTSRLVVALRAASLSIAVMAVCLPLALPIGVLGAVAATVAAVLCAPRLAASRWRLAVLWAFGAGAAAVGLVAGSWLVDSRAGTALLTIRGAAAAGDLTRFGLVAGGVVLAIAVTSERLPTFAVLEWALIAAGLSSLVAAHRNGAIHHPRVLTDWAWTHGHDPARILFLIGAATLLALVAAAQREQRGRSSRVLLHLGAAGALVAFVLLVLQAVGGPEPPRGDGLGLSGKRRAGPLRRAGGGGGASGNQLDQLEFKNDYSSSSPDSPVAVVLLHDDYSPPLGYYYFRQTAFSQYNGHRLVARTRDDLDRDVVTDFPTARTTVPEAPSPRAGRVAVRSTVALMVDHVLPFGLESPRELEPRPSPDAHRFQRLYAVTSASLVAPYARLLGRTAVGATSPAYTELPDDPRYRELAGRIVSSSLRPEYQNDPFAQAVAISTWLGKNSTYSLRSKHADTPDPTADFLFGDRVGYCVHLAHAVAFLLRARGLPSRIAAGYVADEGRKGSGSAILLRQKDAHAWAELQLDGLGWMIIDVAPERSLDPPDTPPDRDLQRLLGELARGDPKAGKLPLEASTLDAWLRLARRLLLALLSAALGLAYAVKLWRWLAPVWSTRRSLYRVAYRAALDRLSEVGWWRAPGETRERFAERASAVAPTLGALTRENVGWAFGAQRLADPPSTRALLRATVGELRARLPWWRILVGWLNPVAWLFSR